MVDEQLVRRGIADRRVLDAFRRVPRHDYVEPTAIANAYDDNPLSIGDGQTISQPYVVAITVEKLGLQGHERVLEIGTGSGYAAAILGELAREVDTVERIERLAVTAAERFARLGITNVHVHHADGTLGWPAGAPYEAICVAAGAPKPPPALLAQLAIGGRLVLPAGPLELQKLIRITRTDETTYDEEDLGGVRFVPLVGEAGWPVG
jgi:protein-L-isoaspartate(D-aspartate) O-methyltransferase